MALNVYRELRNQHPDLRLILVPRHRERFDAVADLVTGSGLQGYAELGNPVSEGPFLSLAGSADEHRIKLAWSASSQARFFDERSYLDAALAYLESG